MKKSKLFLSALAVLGFALTSCGGGGNNGGKGTITVDPLSASELGIDAEYIPSKESIKQRSGTIDVCLDFEGRHVGWQAVADEYTRLQNNAVKVNINWRIAGSEYGTRLNQELENAIRTGSSEWDIVEGNLGYGKTRKACIDFHTFINDPNAWCGDKNERWSDALSRRAYYNYDSDKSWGDHYILSTEDMQSAWFVNTVALEAAAAKGYVNANGEAGYPVTWDDLINLCSKMEEAGYTNPLGISLSQSSIKSLQFTWLLRIYGDYYYRQFYEYVQSGDINTKWPFYDETDKVVENNQGFGTKNCKVLNLLFDDQTTFGPGYVGFKSEVYQDFVKQLAKMKGHFIKNVADTEFSAVRTQFRNQNEGKASAQIILDYLGQGIQYKGSETDSFKLGYFDYPQMISGTYTKASTTGAYDVGDKIVKDTTITRDIGGNGGFVSIVSQEDVAQNELNKDFVKFFLSPYGQTIYYKGLAESEDHITPKGLTTVDNDLVNIPDAWVDFFDDAQEGGIEFNGNVDPNTFLSYGVRYFNGYDKSEANIVGLWNKLLNSTTKYDVASFGAEWSDFCFQDYKSMCKDSDHGWPEDMYKNPEGNL